MEDQNFPANSYAKGKGEVRKDEPKKVEKVTINQVSRRKTPLGKRLRQLFVGGDAQSVGQYILLDVLVPAIKDVIADVVSQGVERMVYGESRSTSRRTGARPSYTSYNRYSSSSSTPWGRDRRDTPPQPTRRSSRGSHTFEEIVVATRGEAEEVIDQLMEIVSKYEQATVADLYELVGEPAEFTDEKWGWTDLRGAGVTRISSGYLLDLPRPEPLDR